MIELKQHDTSRPITDTLTINGVAINLANATVSLIFRAADGTVTKRTATIVSAGFGQVQYTPIPADVATPGIFDLEWEIVFVDSTNLTVPTSGYIRLIIHPDLG